MARPPDGTLSGAVVDASTSRPLAAVILVLAPDTRAVLHSPEEGSSSFLQETRTARTDANGRYHFADVPPGGYQLRVTRDGYRALTLSVELRGSASSRVSVGLQMEPIALAAIEISAPPSEPFAHDARLAMRAGNGRIRAARDRQEEYLAGDVRVLTSEDMVEAVTLAETDIFRAMQRLPGVTSRNIQTAEFWIRGAPWSQTRIYFDGVPVFHPLHGGGMLSGVNPDGLSGAILHPGVQPVATGAGGSGAVVLSSRHGGGSGELRGGAELSVASARLALDQRTPDGRVAWMLAGRRSYVDWITRAFAGDEYWPYAFTDLTGRIDVRLDSTQTLSASGFMARDASSDRSVEQPYNRGRWGSTVGRVSHSGRFGPVEVRHTLGVSRYRSLVHEPTADTAHLEALAHVIVGQTDDRLSHVGLSAEIAPPAAHDRPWSLGYQLVHERSRYAGPPPEYHRAAWDDRLDIRSSLLRGAVWGQRRWQANEHLSIEGAIRLEVAPGVRNAGGLRPAPRLAARFRALPGTSLSLAAGRSYQYVQGLAPVGLKVLIDAPSSQLWVLGDGSTPAVRTDVATLGVETWLADRWLASANSYLRYSTGVVLPDPTPGLLPGSGPLFVVGESQAQGVELSLRRLAGRWTASAAYSYTDAQVEAAALRFPSPTARPHVFNATGMVRAGRALRLGAAYTAASGFSFTRRYLSSEYWAYHALCDGDMECAERQAVYETANGARSPGYARLDLLIDWFHRFRAWELSAYLQVHNALIQRSSIRYSGTFDDCPHSRPCSRADYVPTDKFDQDRTIFPVVGFRARF